MFQNGKLLLYSLGVHPNFFSEGVAEMADVAVPHQPCYVFHLSIGHRQQFAGVLHAAI